jgi:hypothetical protein
MKFGLNISNIPMLNRFFALKIRNIKGKMLILQSNQVRIRVYPKFIAKIRKVF